LENPRGAAALAYHAATCHSEARLRSDPHGLDWENQPIPWRLYRGLEPIPLPRELPESEVPALSALAGAGSAPDRQLYLRGLARVLRFSAGVTKVKRGAGGDLYLRAHPNTGALYHLDVFVVTGALVDLDAGVYHFGAHDFALRRLRGGDYRATLALASAQEPRVASAQACLVVTSTWWRNAWKYRARAYRHVGWDGGALLANLLAVARTAGLAPRVVIGFADPAIESLLALDPRREGAVALVPLGTADAPLPPSAALAPLHLETEPLSPSEVDYPAIREIHAASSLADAEAVRRWRVPARAASEPLSSAKRLPLALPDDSALPAESLERVILRRGSTREFDPDAWLALEELAVTVDRATRPVPADFLAEQASLLDLYVIVHAVRGLPPGAYAYRRGERALELLVEGDLRRRAGRLALGQPLAADACANLYWLADLRAVGARLGDRGYRAAQLEGGVAGGRAYLASYAQGFGATGLTFFDDEVVELLSPHAAGKSVMFLAAIGRSARRPRA
jgi:SagB-type dehydrogenase family enzyme